MNKNFFEVIVIGAGQAGLGASYFLTQYRINHIVFERGKVGESWRSQRWDSFVLNTANKLNQLPGMRENIGQSFYSKEQFVFSLASYAAEFKLPITEQSEIISVEKPATDNFFTVTVSQNNIIKVYKSRQVIICSGYQNKKFVPAFGKNISADVVQLHVSEYRNAAQLPEGNVLLVGSGQSGCQIAEDLIECGRKVYLSTSMVGRVPRKYRGRDIMDWLSEMNFFEVRTDEITDPSMLHTRPPQLTGKDNGTRTMSLQALAKKGATILGKMKNSDGNNLEFEADAAVHVKFADEFSAKVKGMIDEFIEKNNLTMPSPEADDADMPDINADCASSLTFINREEHNIQSVIWATGFSGDFNYLKLPVFDDEGNPKHKSGVTNTEGLYFLTLPWLRKRKSFLIYGAKDDAAFICAKVYDYFLQHKHAGIPS